MPLAEQVTRSGKRKVQLDHAAKKKVSVRLGAVLFASLNWRLDVSGGEP
jgi:hypothetical protein